MKRIAVVAVIGVALLTSGIAQAGTLTFYPTRTAFDTAHPSLPEQSFDSANLFGQPYVTQASPLNSATKDAVFAKGSILPGLTLTTQRPGSKTTALLVTGDGPVGSKSVGNNWYGDTLILQFPKGVAAAGFNVFANTASGPSYAGNITAQFFNGTKSLGAKTFSEAAGGYIFIGGASATPPITSVAITWDADQDASTFVSDITFGKP